MIAEDNEEVEYSKKSKSIQDTLVPTLDTVRYQYMMDLCIKQNRLPAVYSASSLLLLLLVFFLFLLPAIFWQIC